MCLFQLSDGFDNFYTKSELEKKRLNFFLGNTVNYELRVPLLISPRHCLLHMYASKIDTGLLRLSHDVRSFSFFSL